MIKPHGYPNESIWRKKSAGLIVRRLKQSNNQHIQLVKQIV